MNNTVEVPALTLRPSGRKGWRSKKQVNQRHSYWKVGSLRCNQVKVRSQWIRASVLVKGGKPERRPPRGDGRERMEREIRAMRPQPGNAKDGGTQRKRGEAGRLSRSLRRSRALRAPLAPGTARERVSTVLSHRGRDTSFR